jgi:hypothetical protein
VIGWAVTRDLEKVFPGVCSHCGAAWDEAHEGGECSVMDATDRMLQRRPRQVPERPLRVLETRRPDRTMALVIFTLMALGVVCLLIVRMT